MGSVGGPCLPKSGGGISGAAGPFYAAPNYYRIRA